MHYRFINIHLSNDTSTHDERFDTLISPNGTVAALEAIERKHKISTENIVSIDGATYENIKEVFEKVKSIRQDTHNVIFMTVLLYNAEATLLFASQLKQYFGDKTKIILGGQLTGYKGWQEQHPYLANSNIDAVAIGSAENIIPQIINDLESNTLQRRYFGEAENNIFSTFSYDRFADLELRFEAMKETAGFRQLCVQGAGGPGCSWAYTQGAACSFCALQNIRTMNQLPLDEYFTFERSLQEQFQFTEKDRFFAVDNQFIPVMGKAKQVDWLRAYIQARNKHKVIVPKYAYLTVNSIDKERAELLKEAGIIEVYLGVDHFDKEALVEEGKPCKDKAILHRCLRSLKEAGITARIGVVLGAASESEKTFKAVKDGLKEILEKFSTTIKTVGVFPIELLPGSQNFEDMRLMLTGDTSAVEMGRILEIFDTKGYITREDQISLRNYYIKKHSSISLEDFYNGLKDIEDIVTSHDKLTYSVDHSPSKTVLKSM